MSFTKRKILVIHSQQPFNQYAGGGSGVTDSEQYWMRELAKELVALLKTTGHDVRLGPTGDAGSTYQTNVAWVNRAENRDADLLISCHSNATGQPESLARGTTGIGVYHHPNSPKGKAFAQAALPYLKAASAKGKAYIGTLTVAELSSTAPPALLVENEYHDWPGSSTEGGAYWIRHPANRTRLAQAYLGFIVSVFGQQTPEPPKPPTDVLFKAGSYNAQLQVFGGGPYKADAVFIDQVLKVSILAGQEMSEDCRNEVRDEHDYLVWAHKTLGIFWEPKKYDHGHKFALSFGPSTNKYHGLVGTELTSRRNGQKFFAASVHVRPNDAIPGSDADKLKGKLDDIKKVIANLAKYDRVVVMGDFSTSEARGLMEKAGYVLASPWVDTMDKAGVQRIDLVFIRGLVKRTGGFVKATQSSDHHGVGSNLTLPGSDL